MKGKNTIKRLFKGMYIAQYGEFNNHSVKIFYLKYLNEYRNRKLENFVAKYQFNIDNLNSDGKPTKEDKQVKLLLEVLEEMYASQLGERK